MTIRDAMQADVPAIVEMARKFRADSPYATWLRENTEQMTTTVTRLIEGPASTLLVLEHEDGRLVGMIGMMMFPHFLDAVQTAAEIAWWVDPEVRGGVGRQLFEAAEAWAVAEGAGRVMMMAPDTRVAQLYERAGYALAEMSYQKAVA